MADKSNIARAHKIAAELEADGYSATDGSLILSMALGIFVEGQPDSHRNLELLTDAMLRAAQMAFDALRQGRKRNAGHA